MEPIIIAGKPLADKIKAELSDQVQALQAQYGRVPKITVIILGNDPGAESYVAGNMKTAASVGIESETLRFDTTITQEQLLDEIRTLNADTTVDGILVQMPLPKHIDGDRVIETISQFKDVDGFHPLNVAGLWQGRPCIAPCTPKAVIELIKSQDISISGKNVVVMGRSNIVGQPVAKLFLNENATVTIVHSRTQNLAQVCATADILVPAIGKAKLVKADMVKPGAVIIDVGVNRDPETGKLCGDVDFDDCLPHASHISKVPGGVGPITLTMLLRNTIECYLHNVKN